MIHPDYKSGKSLHEQREHLDAGVSFEFVHGFHSCRWVGFIL